MKIASTVHVTGHFVCHRYSSYKRDYYAHTFGQNPALMWLQLDQAIFGCLKQLMYTFQRCYVMVNVIRVVDYTVSSFVVFTNTT